MADDFWMWAFFGALALVTASFYAFHRSRLETQADRESLPRRIDDLHREGIELLAELSEPVEPEQEEGTWTISFDAPPERWEKAEAFDQSIRELFIAEYPALLSDYADRFNEYRRNRRAAEEAKRPDPEEDRRSDAIKLREFADGQHSRPARAQLGDRLVELMRLDDLPSADVDEFVAGIWVTSAETDHAPLPPDPTEGPETT